MANTELEQASSTLPPRLRLAATTEENFLACVKERVWGSMRAIFKDWAPGDLVALLVGQGIAGLAEVTGPAFVAQDEVWKDKIYSHRIPLRFIQAMRPESRLAISQIKEILASAWEPKYGKKWGLGIRSQSLLPPDASKSVIDAIHSCPNDLPEIEQGVPPESLQSCLAELFRVYREGGLREPFGAQSQIWSIFEKTKIAVENIPAVSSRKELLCTWSAGKGVWAAVPWLAILDRRETTSTQRGMYAVFLFRGDMAGVYLTLNQGVTEPKNQLGRREAREVLAKRAAEFRAGLPSLADNGFKLDSDIKLKADAQLAQDYECGTIVHKLYPADTLPTDTEVNDDLEALLSAYQALVDVRVGTNKRPLKSWIFQSNPKVYDIDGALHELKELTWLVNQHAGDIRKGDQVFLWRAGSGAGIVAVATVLTDPAILEESLEEQRFYFDHDKFLEPHLRVRLSISRRVEPPLSRDKIIGEPKLSNLSITKAAQGTNFAVTDEEAAVLLDLISPDSAQEPDEPLDLAPYSIEDAVSGLFLSEAALREMLGLWRAKRI